MRAEQNPRRNNIRKMWERKEDKVAEDKVVKRYPEAVSLHHQCQGKNEMFWRDVSFPDLIGNIFLGHVFTWFWQKRHFTQRKTEQAAASPYLLDESSQPCSGYALQANPFTCSLRNTTLSDKTRGWRSQTIRICQTFLKVQNYVIYNCIKPLVSFSING